MKIHFIEKETMFDIEITDGRQDSAVKFKGFLYDTKGDKSLFLEGDELYDYFSNSPPVSRISVSFFRDKKKYSFYAVFTQRQIKRNIKITELSTASVIEESSRRSAHRFDISMDISIHEIGEDGHALHTYNGYTFDMSYEAVCFYSNSDITQEGKTYIIEFMLFGRTRFRIPARLLHKLKSNNSLHYKNSYVFLFDYTDFPDEKVRLVDAFFEQSVKSHS